jgi:V/A-type H+-transporting ATPase subunit K
MRKKFYVICLIVLCGLMISPMVFAQEAEAANEAEPGSSNGLTLGIKYLSAALAVGLSVVGSGIAVAKVGAAAVAAMGENAEIAGKALPYVGLAEGLALWGFIVALMILFV